MTGRCHVKKAVVCVAQLVAALIVVHGLLSFLSDMYGLFDPSGKMLWLYVDRRRLEPLNDLMTWFSWVAWSVRADLLCSVKLDARWLLVNVHLVLDSTSVLCVCIWLQVASLHLVKNRNNWVPACSDEGLWQRLKCQVSGINFGCIWWI